MEKLRGYDYRIEPADVDFTGRATIMAVGSYILRAAGEDANVFGCGVSVLNEYNASWVLLRLATEMRRMPREYERLRILTWVSDVNRMMTTRNFRIITTDGEIVGEAISNWTMFNIETRRAIDIRLLDGYDRWVEDTPSPIEQPRKLSAVEGEGVFEHKIVYSDIDFNNHCYSINYLAWVVDTLPLDLIAGNTIRRLDINFLHEARYGQTVEVVAHPERRLFELTADGTAACRIALEF